MMKATGGPREGKEERGLLRMDAVPNGSDHATGARSIRYGAVPLSRTFPAAHIQVQRDVLWVAF